MFEPIDRPRLFGIGLGQDFSSQLVHGLEARFKRMDPAAIAQVEIFVNTRRMQRRISSLFQRKSAFLFPRLRLLTDLGPEASLLGMAEPEPSLKRRLEVAQLVKGLLAADQTLAAQDAAFDLADSLVALMSEMQGEGVEPDDIAALDVADQSGHWQRALSFLRLVQGYFGSDQQTAEGRQRQVVEALIARWAETPPTHPIILAGSTGSRGATALLMQAVARLPQGAVILPGVDGSVPGDVWQKLDANGGGEDHPQYRFKALCDALDLTVEDIAPWTQNTLDPTPRARLVSLSLCPAPVTDQWITDGPALGDLHSATDGLTLIEAPTPRAEADAIALRLRQSVEDRQVAALITPDRMLTRKVTAALGRWGIVPDDSAGLPLQLTATGRLLRHTLDLICELLDAEHLLVALRHPLTHSGAERGQHVLRTNALELELRRNGPAFPDEVRLRQWAERTEDQDPGRGLWVDWIVRTVLKQMRFGSSALDEMIDHHLSLANALAAGSLAEGSGALWQEAAGREAERIMAELKAQAGAGGDMTAWDYRRLVSRLLAEGEVRDRDAGHPHVLIWGTLEARVQSADLVILAGLNEGSWPEAPAPDPWLNRTLRLRAGLLLPERRIGLSAHDYQQAICAPQVVLSRAIRSDEAETVPSRWLNRLTNLLGGLADQDGPECLKQMKRRGDGWVQSAAKIAAPLSAVVPAHRPSPRPPVEARPTQLSVTQIKTLIRDPYAIYAQKVLGLLPLDPLAQSADAPLRGIIVHEVLEQFVSDEIDPADPNAEETLLSIAQRVLEEHCPWPAMRLLWLARIAGFVPHFLKEEQKRRVLGTPAGTELRGRLELPELPFTLTGTADRIDLTAGGEARIYDYKTGKAPTENQQLHFDKQLLLEAAMVERGAFAPIPATRTEAAVYVGLGSDLKDQNAPLEKAPAHETLTRFIGLIRKWQEPMRGYTSRSANETLGFEGAYDHLARYGEWDETDDPKPEDMA